MLQEIQAELLILSEHYENMLAMWRRQQLLDEEADGSRKQMLLCQSRSRMMRKNLAHAYSGWCAYVKEGVVLARMADKAAGRHGNQVRAKCVTVWCGHVSVKRDMVGRIATRIADKRADAVSRGFVQWREGAIENKAMRSKAEKALRRWKMRARWCAFLAWWESTMESYRLRCVSQRVVGKMQHRGMSMAFDFWKDAAVDCVMSRAKEVEIDDATMMLQAEQAARIKAEERLQEQCECVSGLQLKLESSRVQQEEDRQRREEENRARRELEVAMLEQQEQLKQVQEEREQLQLSQDALKTDADAMREEVQSFMQQERRQEQQRERAFEVEVHALEMVALRLGDCLTQGRSKAEDFCSDSAGERKRMMEKLSHFINLQESQQDELTQLQQEHRVTKDSLAAALKQVDEAQSRYDVARAEMESDSLTRGQDAEVIRDLRLRLESTGEQLSKCREQLHAEQRRTEQAEAQTLRESAHARQALCDLEKAQQEIEKLLGEQEGIKSEVAGLRKVEQEREHKTRELDLKMESMRSEVEAKTSKVQQLQAELEETRVNLRAAEERAAEVEAKLPAAIDKSESLQQERIKQMRQLELVGERVLELEAACHEQAQEIQKLEDELVQLKKDRERLREEAARVAARMTADHDEERLAWETQIRTERENALADVERERGAMAADREAELASWAIERERLREGGAAAVEQEREHERQRLAALKQEHEQDLMRVEALKEAAQQEHALEVAAARRAKQTLEAQLQVQTRELQAQLEQNALIQDQLTRLQAARDDAAAKQGAKEAEMQAAVLGLEDKLRRGAEERRALEIACSSVKLELERRVAAHQRLLQEQSKTRGLLPGNSLALDSSSLEANARGDEPSDEASVCPREHEIRCRGAMLDLKRQLQELEMQLEAAIKVGYPRLAAVLVCSWIRHTCRYLLLTRATHIRMHARTHNPMRDRLETRQLQRRSSLEIRPRQPLARARRMRVLLPGLLNKRRFGAQQRVWNFFSRAWRSRYFPPSWAALLCRPTNVCIGANGFWGASPLRASALRRRLVAWAIAACRLVLGATPRTNGASPLAFLSFLPCPSGACVCDQSAQVQW